jgi:hypothetical protein
MLLVGHGSREGKLLEVEEGVGKNNRDEGYANETQRKVERKHGETV